MHKRAEVIDTYPDDRPDWMVWDGKKSVQQHGQHVEYTLRREGVDRTRVRFDITLEP